MIKFQQAEFARDCCRVLIFLGCMLVASPAFSTFAVIEVGDGTLPVTVAPGPGVATPFTTINFQATFENPPNVFTMTLENAANPDPCTIRIRNVTTTGFDAACHEPINEDRASGGMVFQYIAIQDGGLTVPLAGGGGNVDFVSNCVNRSNQQYGPACAGCSGPTSYTGVTFPAAFTAAPALLTQVQTTNNLTAGEPVFLDVAVETGSLSTTGFNVALDQMEAGTGPLSTTEEICYLAVERNGCEDLDFSSFEGPASVMFEAATGGQNVDGHGNGCTTGEGVTFTGGCFTATPVALAKQITRRGNNGGFIRRCSVNSSEIILTFDEDRVSNTERNHIDEIASALAFETTFTTPVTLVRAHIKEIGRRVKFEWTTSAETFHLGFDLWGEVDGEWTQLNKRMIPGSGVDTAQSTDYKASVRLNRYQSDKVTRFGISSIDIQGQEEFYGPFESGIDYGKQSVSEPIDWSATREAFEQRMADKGYVKLNDRWRRISHEGKQRLKNHQAKQARQVINIGVQQPGIQRITADQIIAVAPNLRNTPLHRLAVSLNGEPVPRYIISNDNRLNAGDELLFYAKSPIGSDAVYLRNYTYQLKVDRFSVLDANRFDGAVDDDVELDTSAYTELTLTSAKKYAGTIIDDEPWYDRQLIATSSPSSASYQFDFSDEIDLQSAGELDFAVHGGIDFPGQASDHHVQILVNDSLVYDGSFNGFIRHSGRASIPPGTLKQTDNTLVVQLPADTGFFADMVLIDTLAIRVFGSLAGRSTIDFMANPAAAGYEVSSENAAGALVLAYNEEGAISVIDPVVTGDGRIRFANLPICKDVRYAIAATSDWANNTHLELVEPAALDAEKADYLIVAHPAFMGETLDRFIKLKEQRGHLVKTVSWLDIVAYHGYGNATPSALNQYLAAIIKDAPLQNVLIVGGHSFDYLGITQPEIINAIPSHYRPVSVLNFSPTDNPFADLDNDELPDLAIGRWPVRNIDDLSAIVNKTEQWHENRNDDQYQSALLVSQTKDNRSLEFSSQMLGRVEIPLSAVPEFEDITHLDIQQIIDSGVEDPIAYVRQQLRDSIDGGADLLSFAGHGSPVAWGFQSIVDTEFVQSLNNSQSPLVVMPLACYTTYFESTSVNTLAHQWLFAGDQGAAAVHGAAVLGEYRENAVFAERVLNASSEVKTLGKAILNAKRKMVSGNSMLNNWVLLGDPDLPLR